jgi:hypothetical protein
MPLLMSEVSNESDFFAQCIRQNVFHDWLKFYARARGAGHLRTVKHGFEIMILFLS